LPFSIVPELCLSLKKRLESEEKEQQRQAAMNYLNDAVDDLPTDFANTLILGAFKLTKEEKQLVAQEAIKALKNNIQKINGNYKKYVHEVSSLERSDLLRWIELAISKTPSELKDLSYSLKTLEAEAETIKGYLFNAPSDELLKPLFSKLGKLHEELGHFAQEQVSQENKYQTAINQLKALKTEHDNLFNEKIHFDKQNLQVKLAIKSQKVLEEYLELSRAEKINEFKENFLECFNLLIGKQNMVGDANISQLNFNIELLSPRGIPIAKSELSAGERQIYAMAMIWSLAKTSGRALPLFIDTPLGRFDSDHRNNVLENFLSNASHQMIIFSTNTEVDKPYFNQLKPYIAKAYNLEYDSSEGKTVVKEGYFWDILEGNN
jgi:DNA sulfur modification protein DndD